MPDGTVVEFEPAKIEAADTHLQAANSAFAEIFTPLKRDPELLGKLEKAVGFEPHNEDWGRHPIYEGPDFQLFEEPYMVIVPSENNEARDIFSKDPLTGGFAHEAQKKDRHGWITTQKISLALKKQYLADPTKHVVSQRGTDKQIDDSIKRFQEAATKIVAHYHQVSP